MKIFKTAGIGLLCAGLFMATVYCGEAIAQTVTVPVQIPNDNQVVIEWGAILGNVATFLASFAALFVTFLFRALPGEWAAMAKTARVDHLLEKAIQYGANTVKDATLDKKMTVPVANDVIEKAVEYALEMGPPTITNWVGGEDGLRKKIIARIDVATTAAIPASPPAIKTLDSAASPAKTG